MEKHLSYSLLITCEHASRRVPPAYRPRFAGHKKVLLSHRGWDPGAMKLAEILSVMLEAPLLFYPWTRLLVEPNRSPGHPGIFSEFSRNLPKKEKNLLMQQYYFPYRMRVERTLAAIVGRGKTAVHVGVHSFTPELNGKLRHVEIGLLYDPKRPSEKNFCHRWRRHLQKQIPGTNIRMNHPYKGSSDGLTTTFRTVFDDSGYLGIELEVRQDLLSGSGQTKEYGLRIARSLQDTLTEMNGIHQTQKGR